MKRRNTSQPLTADDVAERLDKAALRLLRIMMEVRQTEGALFEDVRRSGYHSNLLDLVADEITTHWRPGGTAAGPSGHP